MPTDRFQEKAEIEVYANTLLDELNASGGIDAVLEARGQMEQIVAYNRSHVELMDAVSDTTYTVEQRSALVKGVFAGASPALAGMLGVLAERSGLEKLPRVLDVFNSQISEKLGYTVVDVVTRVPLDDHLRDIIKDKASAELGGNIILREQIDSALLGGIIMSAGSKRIDASMNTMLEGARSALKKSN